MRCFCPPDSVMPRPQRWSHSRSGTIRHPCRAWRSLRPQRLCPCFPCSAAVSVFRVVPRSCFPRFPGSCSPAFICVDSRPSVAIRDGPRPLYLSVLFRGPVRPLGNAEDNVLGNRVRERAVPGARTRWHRGALERDFPDVHAIQKTVPERLVRAGNSEITVDLPEPVAPTNARSALVRSAATRRRARSDRFGYVKVRMAELDATIEPNRRPAR